MNIIQGFLSNFTWDTIVKTGLRISMLLVLAWIAMKLIQKFLQRLEKHLIKKSEDEGEPPSESEKRVETIVRLIKQGCLIALWLTFGLVIITQYILERKASPLIYNYWKNCKTRKNQTIEMIALCA